MFVTFFTFHMAEELKRFRYATVHDGRNILQSSI